MTKKRSKFITFAVASGGIALFLFLSNFVLSLRAKTPDPRLNIRYTAPPVPVRATPSPIIRATPEAIVPTETISTESSELEIIEEEIELPVEESSESAQVDL